MTQSRVARAVALTLPFLLGAYVVALNASLGRPLWIDEFTHFAFATAPSTRDAWSLFLATANDNQHGQTGVYILLNYWTLTTLGLDPTLLRLPSILSGLFLFSSAILLFRALGFSMLWQVVMVGALTGQHLLMHYLGEARAYAPIPAAAVGLLYYYVARSRQAPGPGLRAFGIFTAVFGATMHPYFALYWPAVILVAYVHNTAATEAPFSLRALIRFANPGLVALGAGLYLLLGTFTWLRGHQPFGFDPFEWMQLHGPVASFTNYSHTQFLEGSYSTAAIFTGIAALGALVLPMPARGRVRGLLAPILLILLSVAISLLLSWISYTSQYWILTRQWVGSVALIAVGTVWFWAEAARIWSRLTPLLGLKICAIALMLVSGQAMAIVEQRQAELLEYLAAPHATVDPQTCAPPTDVDLASLELQERNDWLVALANRNITCGGPIWPIFRKYLSNAPR